MDYQELEQKVIKAQLELFKDRIIPDGYGGSCMTSREEGAYVYFAPAWHVRFGLITPKLVEDLQQGKNMLSVGCGPAYLERLLAKTFNIPQENIGLADREPVYLKGFRSYQFDMFKAWKGVKGKFDYIIFPESLVACMERVGRLRKDFRGTGYAPTMGFENLRLELIKKALTYINRPGQIRASPYPSYEDEILIHLREMANRDPALAKQLKVLDTKGKDLPKSQRERNTYVMNVE